jgi:hypothetical protein
MEEDNNYRLLLRCLAEKRDEASGQAPPQPYKATSCSLFLAVGNDPYIVCLTARAESHTKNMTFTDLYILIDAAVVSEPHYIVGGAATDARFGHLELLVGLIHVGMQVVPSSYDLHGGTFRNLTTSDKRHHRLGGS